MQAITLKEFKASVLNAWRNGRKAIVWHPIRKAECCILPKYGPEWLAKADWPDITRVAVW